MNKRDKLIALILFVTFLFVFDFSPSTFNVWYYGVRYNDVRKTNRIQTIPLNWQQKKTSRNYIFWHPKSSASSSHIGKEIKTKLFSVINERDTYIHEDEEKGKQEISITQYYTSSDIDVEYFLFIGSFQEYKETLSFKEAEKIIFNWSQTDGKNF